MPLSQRLYHCLRCHAQVVICTRCDRGNRYCSQGCSRFARQESRKRATTKYQQTRLGRTNNAGRQQRFRDRKKQKVTHQCSIELPLHDVVKTRSVADWRREKTVKSKAFEACHFCQQAGTGFFRQDFLHSSHLKPSFRRRE